MKRFIAIFMTLCLVLGVSSISAWAAEESGWKDEPSMPQPAGNFGTCVINDNIYVLGGVNSNLVQIYNIKSQTWDMGTSMLQSTSSTKAAALGNKIYAIGSKGTNYYSDFTTIMQVYDLDTKKWTVKSDVPVFHNVLGVAAIGEKIYVVYHNVLKNQTGISIYDTLSEKWTSSNSISSKPRASAEVCSLGTNIYVVGGIDSDRSSLLEIYDTITDTWKIASSMPTARSNFAVVMVGNKMYALGGGSNSFSKVEIYDTETNSWATGPALKKERISLGAVFADGKVYAMGGNLDNGWEKYVQSLQVGNSSGDLNLSVLLNTGESVQLSTSFNLDNNKNYTWSSTNEAVATVDVNGKVTAIAEGTADIYAQNADGTFKEYIPVKVVKGIADELRLAVHLKIGEKAKLYLTDDASKVTWTSMDNSIATVSADGQVTGVKKGLAIIKGELEGKSYQIYVRVNG